MSRPLPALCLALGLLAAPHRRRRGSDPAAQGAGGVEGRAGHAGPGHRLPDGRRRRPGRHALSRAGPDGHARPADAADRLGRRDQGRQGHASSPTSSGPSWAWNGSTTRSTSSTPRSSRPSATPTATARPTRASTSSPGLGPKLPGFSGINDHVASGVRLGMDGFLYISVGDKGIPQGVGKDGTTIQLYGGGVIRIRPDGTGLEVVSTGERNPLSVALTRDRRDLHLRQRRRQQEVAEQPDAPHRRRPLRLPVPVPDRPRPLPADHGRPDRRLGRAGDLLQRGRPARRVPRQPLLLRLGPADASSATTLEKAGGTFKVARDEPVRHEGGRRRLPALLARPSATDGTSLYLVDWAFNGWLADGPKTGRLYRLTYEERRADDRRPAPPATDRGLDSRRSIIRRSVVRLRGAAGPGGVRPGRRRSADRSWHRHRPERSAAGRLACPLGAATRSGATTARRGRLLRGADRRRRRGPAPGRAVRGDRPRPGRGSRLCAHLLKRPRRRRSAARRRSRSGKARRPGGRRGP